jgi:thiamine biosynthesis lipoprotein
MKWNWKTASWGVVLLMGVGIGGRLGSQRVENPSWAQPTMGTICHITVSGSIRKAELQTLRGQIDAALLNVNDQMSTWQPDSEISLFNAFHSEVLFPVSPEFSRVIRRALEISSLTDGAFDPTVKPLVDYWGFGSGEAESSLDAVRETVGWQKVIVSESGLNKRNDALQLDLSAIAKGYGVDRVAEVIQASGRIDYMVEIGGEVVTSGTNPTGSPWRIGVESPDPEQAFGASIFQVLELSGHALATSGDYRNFRERDDGSRYSHLIDPRTGHPAKTDIAAVSVLASNCMDADAVATALFVMGSEKGIPWVEDRPGFEALFILHAEDGAFRSVATGGFPADD